MVHSPNKKNAITPYILCCNITLEAYKKSHFNLRQMLHRYKASATFSSVLFKFLLSIKISTWVIEGALVIKN